MDISNTFGVLVLKAGVFPIERHRFPLYINKLHEGGIGPGEEVVAEFVAGKRTLPAITRVNSCLKFYFDIPNLISDIIRNKAIEQKRPLCRPFPFVFHIGSVRMRACLYKAAILWSKIKNARIRDPYPAWPIDVSLSSLLHVAATQGISPLSMGIYAGPWPDGKKSVVCLSHDVDSYHGYLSIPKITAVEKRYHVKATYNIPGMRYKVDLAYLKRLEDEGFEFGIHGYKHTQSSPFLGAPELTARLQRSLERFRGLTITGYRSPALLRTKRLFEVLSQFLEYDSSVPDTENFLHSRSVNNGCSIPFPYMVGTILEIPLTVPQDAVLLALAYSPEKILDCWLEKIAFLKKIGGVIVLNTHPDPPFLGNAAMLDIYDRLLSGLARDPELCCMTMGQLNTYVRGRMDAERKI